MTTAVTTSASDDLRALAKSRSKATVTYRPDIDGLRAVAVTSVVGYHAFANWFPGGFVGVDVFFVISGYLISTILLTDLAADRFSIAGFYARRVRRIFPALILVLIFSAVVGWIALFGFEYEALGKQIAASTTFASNFLLWSEAGYFAKAAETKPLLHLWSLAIEEQFYIFWPFFLLATWRLRVNKLCVFVAGFIASFAFNIYESHIDPTADFYSPLARFWELLVGAMLAEFTLRRPAWIADSERRLDKAIFQMCRIDFRIADFKAIVGLLLLAFAVLRLNQNSPFPSYAALLPVIGAFLIISAGEEAWPNGLFLNNRVMVWIGLISYPLYLWHWPLLSFFRIIFGERPSPGTASVLVLVSFALASATFLFVERPIRFSSSRLTKILGLVGMLAAIGGTGAYTVASAGFPGRNEGAEKIIEAMRDWHPPEPNSVYAGVPAWSAGSAVGNAVLFVGDSQMQQYFPRLKHLSEKRTDANARRLIMVTRTGCAPLPGIFRQVDPADVTTGYGCGDFLRKVLPFTKDANVGTVVLAGAWFEPFNDPNFYVEVNGVEQQLINSRDAQDQVFSNFGNLIRGLVTRGKKVFVVRAIPRVAGPLSMLPVGWGRLSGRPALPPAPSRKSIEELAGFADNRVAKTARESGAIVINPIDFFCSHQVCPIVSPDGRPYYMDAFHLRASFVRDSVKYLDTTID